VKGGHREKLNVGAKTFASSRATNAAPHEAITTSGGLKGNLIVSSSSVLSYVAFLGRARGCGLQPSDTQKDTSKKRISAHFLYQTPTHTHTGRTRMMKCMLAPSAAMCAMPPSTPSAGVDMLIFGHGLT